MQGRTIPVKILDLDGSKKRLVLSADTAVQDWAELRRTDLLRSLHVGDIVEGEVCNLTNFGAFVDLGGLTGLIRTPQITWKHIKHPSEILQLGDWIKVYVLEVDPMKGHISLSLKMLLPEPWSQVEEKYPVDAWLKAMLSISLIMVPSSRSKTG